jgi:UDP-glucose 4-epimerase
LTNVLDAGSTAAVIGASGFIGGATARRLEQDGLPTVRYTRADPFLSPAGDLAEALVDASVIFWLASSIRPARSEAAAVDQRLLEDLLSQLAKRGSQARIVAISSGGTVYDTDFTPPYSELSPVRSANEYGRAMLAVETLLRDCWPDHVVLRASNAYGPGQPARRGQGVIAHWLDSILREEPIRIMGDPEVKRDYVYIDDLVTALLAAGHRHDAPRILNIGSGIPTSLRELATIVNDAVGSPVEVEQTPGRTFDAPSTWLDVSLARTALGWRPHTDLSAGVRNTWRQLQHRRDPTTP